MFGYRTTNHVAAATTTPAANRLRVAGGQDLQGHEAERDRDHEGDQLGHDPAHREHRLGVRQLAGEDERDAAGDRRQDDGDEVARGEAPAVGARPGERDELPDQRAPRHQQDDDHRGRGRRHHEAPLGGEHARL